MPHRSDETIIGVVVKYSFDAFLNFVIKIPTVSQSAYLAAIAS